MIRGSWFLVSLGVCLLAAAAECRAADCSAYPNAQYEEYWGYNRALDGRMMCAAYGMPRGTCNSLGGDWKDDSGSGSEVCFLDPQPHGSSRSNGSGARCEQVKSDLDDQLHRPMSAAWKRALLCIPGLMCDAKCSDFDDYEQVLTQNRELERKWVLQCHGTITLINGDTVDRDSLDAHEDQLYQDFLEKKRQVCEAERAADQAQDDQDTCELGLGIARKVLSTASSRVSVAKLTAARADLRSSCASLEQPPDAYKEVDAQLSKAIAAAQAPSGSTTAAGKQTASGNAAPPAKSAAKPANPRYPVSAQAASTLPPQERWMATGSPADCAAASALEKTTAGWYDMCVPDPARGGSAPTAKKLKALKKVPAPIARAGDLSNALATLLQSLPQDAAQTGDDGRPCGQWSGYRARGRCFAPWYGNTPQACQTDLGGTYYPASANRPISFCAYEAAAPPLADDDFCGKAGGHMDDGICWILGLTRSDCDDLHGRSVDGGGNQYCAIGASPAPRTAKDGESCGDAGGHVHGNACWIIGLTPSDCDGVHGKIVESEGYQYCAYDPAAAIQTVRGPGSKPASDNLRDRLRKSLSAGGNASADNADDRAQGASQTAGAPKAPAPAPKQITQKTMTAAEERKACAALGSKWRYDPTATYNFSPGAPVKCFPIFTEGFEGEPGFETKQ